MLIIISIFPGIERHGVISVANPKVVNDDTASKNVAIKDLSVSTMSSKKVLIMIQQKLNDKIDNALNT